MNEWPNFIKTIYVQKEKSERDDGIRKVVGEEMFKKI